MLKSVFVIKLIRIWTCALKYASICQNKPTPIDRLKRKPYASLQLQTATERKKKINIWNIYFFGNENNMIFGIKS